jgi:thiol-disulfide isomerase/thioredoxin
LTGAGKDNTYADKILQRIELLQALEKGAVAPNFSLNTPEGETLSMHEIPGKVKIIDFWASWCYPCRKENPFMVKLYEKYHEKGLEIIGVSLDNDHKKWTAAIEKDGLPWIQISALKKWQCKSVKLYDVKSVPHTVILDGENRIIARNVRGEELEKLIAQILDAQ